MALVCLLFATASAGQAVVSGYVTDKFTRAPLAGVEITAHMSTSPWTGEVVGNTVTGTDGRYSFQIRPANYIRVGAELAGYFRESVLTSTGVAPQTIDFQLEPEIYGELVVALLDKHSGLPISGTYLLLSGPRADSRVETDANGEARFRELRSGSFSLCAFDEDDRYIDGCYLDPSTGLNAAIDLAPGEIRSVEVRLEEGVSVKGVVTHRHTDLPLADTVLRFSFYDATSGNTIEVVDTRSGSSGEYRVQGIRPGRVRVRALASPGTYPFYESRLYGDVRCAPDGCPEGEGTVIDLASSQEGIDFRLGPSAALSGKVTDADTGAGLPYIEVAAVNYHPFGSWNITKVTTDPSGHYTLTHLPEGEALRLRTSNTIGYFNQRWPGQPCSERDCDRGTDIVLGPGQSEEVFDFSLTRGPSISGAISNAITRRPAWARVEIYNEQGHRVFVDLTDDGRYRTPALPAGTYKVQATNPRDFDDCEYFRASPCSAGRANATPVVIGAVDDAVSIDLAIREQVIAADGFESD